MASAPGIIAVNRKGNASPRPMARNIEKIVIELEVRAKVRAVPRKGAEQGVERIVVKTPPKKSPTKPSSVFAFPSFDPPGVMNSNNPNRFKLKINNTIIIERIKVGDCN